MKSLWRYAMVAAGLMAAFFLLVACGEEEEEEAVAPTAPAATEEAALPETPAEGEEEAPPSTATPTVGADPEDFAEFADLIADAVTQQDTAFFADRVQGRPYTCSEVDFAAEGLGPPTEHGLCQEVGQQVEVAEFSYWHSEGLLMRPEALAEQIDKYFASALPGENDGYGTGAVRLYAMGETRSTDPERAYKAAILTAITPRGEGAAGETARTARGVHFDYVEGRWVIRGMRVAEVLAEELLSADTAAYDGWQRY